MTWTIIIYLILSLYITFFLLSESPDLDVGESPKEHEEYTSKHMKHNIHYIYLD